MAYAVLALPQDAPRLQFVDLSHWRRLGTFVSEAATHVMPTNDAFEQFHRLIKHGDVVGVRTLIASGADRNVRNRFGWTPLMVAANKVHTPIISLLLAKDADVQAVNDVGASALAYAALRGACQPIQQLLDAGAALDVRPHGVSLMEFAGWGGGNFETPKHFELLRAAGAT